ncbi:hypothetical protein GCM10023094_50650 [Rhodococcus olei]|uniref:Sigma-K anti-sigma factor RskA n=2 Tax=Rhodococcus olei TaxID=2161675 RepID=A0ABP8PKU3_9NOCA
MRPLLGMGALGRLGDQEGIALRAHLDGCPRCRAEYRDLASVAAALDQADPDRLGDVPAPPSTLPDAIAASIGRERVRRRYRRVAVLAAAAVLAVGLVTGGFVLRGVVAGGPAGRPVAVAVASAGVEASARVENRAWGTGISLDVSGLPEGRTYNVWLQRADGSRTNAGSFIAGGDRTMSMQLAAALPMSDAVTLGVSAPGDDHVVWAAQLHG